MNTSNILIGIVLVAVLGIGGWFIFVGQNKDDAMMGKDDSMIEESGNTMTEKDTAIMEDPGDAILMEDNSMMEKNEAMTEKGSYEPYSSEKVALAKEGNVVLFFRAAWCPTCRALDADIKAHLGDIPAGTTILDVNYDTETALKAKYGVTYQHTFVQVDASGNQITKWSGSPTLADLVAKIN